MVQYEQAGVNDRRRLRCSSRIRTRAVVGGLTGRTSLGLLFVDLFYLPANCAVADR